VERDTAQTSASVIEDAHGLSARELADSLGTDLERGLSSDEARQRLDRFGSNKPRSARRPPYLRLALNQLIDPLVALLVAATAVSVAIGDTAEGVAIAAVLLLNGALGFWEELRAELAILALSEAFTHTAVVVRDEREQEIDAAELVPGDLLIVTEGERIAADARVVEARALDVDESALTGESLPVTKRVEAVPVAVPLAERASMLYAGTGVTRGRARAVVSATGPATELGRIQTLASHAKAPPTPLERRLGSLARQMVVVGVVLTFALSGAMVLRGEPLHSAFLVGVAVAVAAVPEGLAATVTAALALGARAMARRGAIVRRLDAIETLGETTVICSDKTGTLTENRIQVAALRAVDDADERTLLAAAVLASNAHEVGAEVVGDPIDSALLAIAMERGMSREEIVGAREAVYELPFDSDRKRMTIVYTDDGRRRAFTKGAPEVVAESFGDAAMLELVALWAGEGFRVLAVAAGDLDADIPLDAGVEDGLQLVGIIALHDPLRSTAAQAIDAAHRAGIAVRMLTGDHPATARTIGRALGLEEDAIVARATPAEKLALVESLQDSGEVVAVTGDGVNDAPALRRANVGVAMGRGGTEAAREAAAIVLTDDDFATIVAAVAEGRRIGDNIRKFVAFLLSANLGEVIVFAVAIVAGLGTPLAVIQVLLVNVVTDGLPAVALAQDPSSATTMSSPPRRGDRLFTRGLWLRLAGIGVLVGAAALSAFMAGKAFGGGREQTMAFATLALSELALVFGMRSSSASAWRLPANRWLSWSALSSAGLVIAIVYLPAAHDPFATVSLPVVEALVVAALAALPLFAVELAKLGGRRRHSGSTRDPQKPEGRIDSFPDGTEGAPTETEVRNARFR
jgi:Ca2+-transporting ATPase